MRVALFLPSFDAGGAQRQFVQLAAGLAERGHEVICVALVPGGPYWQPLAGDPRLRLHALYPRAAPGRLALRSGWTGSAFRLRRLLAEERPDILYSALHAANLVAWLASAGGRRVPLVWGMRAARQSLPWRRRLPYALCALLSPRVDLLLANAAEGLAEHRACGYRPKAAAVVANGIDTAHFRPDAEARHRVRAEWNVADDVPLVGMVGRLVPVKDHGTFLRAAALLASRSGARFVCIGGGGSAHAQSLREEAVRLGLTDRLVWAGERSDMPAVFNALDVLCLPSLSEAFPNALAEAMACGVPCVATPVGDVPFIIGEAGRLVPVGDAASLAREVEELLAMDAAARRVLGLHGRTLITAHYGLDVMVEATDRALAAVLARRAGAPPDRATTRPAAAPGRVR